MRKTLAELACDKLQEYNFHRVTCSDCIKMHYCQNAQILFKEYQDVRAIAKIVNFLEEKQA